MEYLSMLYATIDFFYVYLSSKFDVRAKKIFDSSMTRIKLIESGNLSNTSTNNLYVKRTQY